MARLFTILVLAIILAAGASVYAYDIPGNQFDGQIAMGNGMETMPSGMPAPRYQIPAGAGYTPSPMAANRVPQGYQAYADAGTPQPRAMKRISKTKASGPPMMEQNCGPIPCGPPIMMVPICRPLSWY